MGGDEGRMRAALTRTPHDLGAVDREGRHALHWAAQRGHTHLAKELLKQRAAVHAADLNGALCIHLAAFEGHLALVKAFERAASGILRARTTAHAQPLHLAASRGHTAVVKFMLRHSAEAGARDSNG